ncbi:MAG: Gfo/Idh/MocA family protein [Micrococcales bacterium]
MSLTIPEPRLIDPQSVTPYRWGIMGAAKIADAFVGGVKQLGGQQVVAVASRTPGKAETFAAKHNLEWHDNYEDLLAREDIDIIYIPTLPNQHRDHALLAIAAGKHVLLEKPVTLRVSEAEEIFSAAKAKGVLVMEAMWTRYLPQYDSIRQILEAGTLGEIELISVTMCQANGSVPRLFTKNQGDPFFDMGIYPVSFAQSFLGEPIGITAQGILAENGIDQEVSVQLRYANGARAYILLSAISAISGAAHVGGSKAKLTVGPEFFIPTRMQLAGIDMYDPVTEWVDTNPVQGHHGLGYQATAMAKFIDDGLLESPYESHEQSLANLRVCEEVVRLIGAEIY